MLTEAPAPFLTVPSKAFALGHGPEYPCCRLCLTTKMDTPPHQIFAPSSSPPPAPNLAVPNHIHRRAPQRFRPTPHQQPPSLRPCFPFLRKAFPCHACMPAVRTGPTRRGQLECGQRWRAMAPGLNRLRGTQGNLYDRVGCRCLQWKVEMGMGNGKWLCVQSTE